MGKNEEDLEEKCFLLVIKKLKQKFIKASFCLKTFFAISGIIYNWLL